MKDIGQLQTDIWSRIRKASEEGDAGTLRRLGTVADDMDRKYEEWLRLSADDDDGSSQSSMPRTNGNGPHEEDFTGRSIYGAEFNGEKFQLGSYQDLLLTLIDRLHKMHPDKFDEIAVRVRGRGPYFAVSPQELRSAHKLKGSPLFVEKNLSAQTIVKICRKLVNAFGYDRSSLRIDAAPASKSQIVDDGEINNEW